MSYEIESRETVERGPVRQTVSGFEATGRALSSGELRVALARRLTERVRETTRVKRTARHRFESALAAEARSGDALDFALTLPFNLAYDALGLLWSAPVEALRGAIAAIDPAPEVRDTTRERRERLPEGAEVVLELPGELPRRLRAGPLGVVAIDAGALAREALVRGAGDLVVRLHEPARPEVEARLVLAVEDQLRLAAGTLPAAPEARELAWRELAARCPARAIRAALEARAAAERARPAPAFAGG